MTEPVQSAAAGLPVSTPALEPGWVRHGTAAVQKQYAAALEFEQMLVTQLATALTQSGELGGSSSGEEGGSESEPGASIYSSMLPQALASGVVGGGGLGLAEQLTRQLTGSVATGTPAAQTPPGTTETPTVSSAVPDATGGTSAQ
jgi:Rod binding domain-containing protein